MTNPTPAEEAARLYTTAVEMADRVSARRGSANQFYLSIETLLLGVPTFFGFGAWGTDSSDAPRATLLAGLGVVVSAAWWLQLRSYRQLNKAKFDVIGQIEKTHFSIHPFSDEWKILKKDDDVKRWQDRYAELGTIERVVPLIFLGANIIVAVWAWL
jgi:hypothetical protein